MKISYFLLAVNFVTTVVAYYRKCYQEFSVCLITNTDNPWLGSEFRLNQRAADDWCKEKSSFLAIITNATVQSALEAFIKDSSAKLNSDVIITNGNRSILNKWEWIGGRTPANHTGLVLYHYRYAYCFSTTKNGLFYTDNPSLERNFICSSANLNSSCPDDHQQVGNSCYKIYNNKKNWFDARNLCIHEEYDLATFKDIDLSNISRWLPNGAYWIGLRRERWYWSHGQTLVEIKYSNWDTNKPSPTGGGCLCMAANTGKWKDCGCYQNHRYICIQGYTSDSSAVSASITTPLTTSTATTTQTDPSSTPITTGKTLTDGRSTLITIMDDNHKHPDDSKMLLVIGLGIACLLILIVVIAVVVHVRTRRSSSHHPGPSCDAPSTTTVTNADAPNTVYAEIIPKASESTRSPSEETPHQIVYAELDLIPKGNKDGKALQELEYANSMQLNSVYANYAHTRV